MKLPNYIKALNVNIVFIVLAFFCYKGVTAYNYYNSYEYKLKKYNDCFEMLKKDVIEKGGFYKIYESIKTEINSGYDELKKYIHPRDLAILCMRLRTDAIDSMSGNERSKEKDALFFPSEQIELNDEWEYDFIGEKEDKKTFHYNPKEFSESGPTPSPSSQRGDS